MMTEDEAKFVNLEPNETLILVGPIQYPEDLKTKGKAFLTSDKIVFWHPTYKDATITVKLEDIKHISASTLDKTEWNPKHPKVVKINLRLSDGKRRHFITQVEVSKSAQINMAVRLFSGYSVPNLVAMQNRLTAHWMETIQNAIRDKELELLKAGAIINTWKCEYCETLNEAQKERCSHCGSPRRIEA